MEDPIMGSGSQGWRTRPYGPPPWKLLGSAVTVWVAQSRRGSINDLCTPGLEVEDDALVAVRFWNLHHDSGWAGSPSTRLEEVSISVPVRYQGRSGTHPIVMYANDPIYTAFGREAMGWPVMPAPIEFTAPAPASLEAGTEIAGRLVVADQSMSVEVALGAERPGARERNADGGQADGGTKVLAAPVWLGGKIIPGVDFGAPALHQMVLTRADAFDQGQVWEGESARLGMTEGFWLRDMVSTEVIRSEHLAGLELTLGRGEVLTDLLAGPRSGQEG